MDVVFIIYTVMSFFHVEHFQYFLLWKLFSKSITLVFLARVISNVNTRAFLTFFFCKQHSLHSFELVCVTKSQICYIWKETSGYFLTNPVYMSQKRTFSVLIFFVLQNWWISFFHDWLKKGRWWLLAIKTLYFKYFHLICNWLDS